MPDYDKLLQSRLFNQPHVAVVFDLHEFAERRRRGVVRNLGAAFGQRLANFRVAQQPGDIVMQLRDDDVRHARGRRALDRNCSRGD